MGLPLESEPNFTVCLMSLFQICLPYAEIDGLRTLASCLILNIARHVQQGILGQLEPRTCAPPKTVQPIPAT